MSPVAPLPRARSWSSVKDEVWGNKACLLGVGALAIAIAFPELTEKARGMTEVFIDEGAKAAEAI
jgi:hypothetical protein